MAGWRLFLIHRLQQNFTVSSSASSELDLSFRLILPLNFYTSEKSSVLPGPHWAFPCGLTPLGSLPDFTVLSAKRSYLGKSAWRSLAGRVARGPGASLNPALFETAVRRYTREAGVRSLDRRLGAICRAVAVKVAEGQHKDTKPDRAEGADGEGLWLSRVLLTRGLLTCSLGSSFISLFSLLMLL